MGEYKKKESDSPLQITFINLTKWSEDLFVGNQPTNKIPKQFVLTNQKQKKQKPNTGQTRPLSGDFL